MEIINKIGKYRVREWYKRNVSDIKFITVHHSAIQQSTTIDTNILDILYKGHIGFGWPGLSYHFVITPNGNIYQINDFSDLTWHDSINSDSIGVLVHGYFQAPYNETPTPAQLISLKALLDWLCTQNPQFPAGYSDVVGHRERSATECPGDNLITYVKEYRTKLGQVTWGNTVPTTLVSVPSIDPCASIKAQLEAKRVEAERAINENNRLATYVGELQDSIARMVETNRNLNEQIIALKKKLTEVTPSSNRVLNDYSMKELLGELLSRLT